MSYLDLRRPLAPLGLCLLLFACAEGGGSEPCAPGEESCGEARNPQNADDDDSDDAPEPAVERDPEKPGKGDAASDKPAKPGADAAIDKTPDRSGGPNLPCDVKEIVEAHCGTCHGATPTFGAPMPLVTAADFQASAGEGSKMHQLVKERLNESDPRMAMPPASSKQPSAAQRATLNEWLDEGAPGSSQTCAVPSSPDAGGPAPQRPFSEDELECHKLLAHGGDLKSKYKVGAVTDAYYTFTFKAPWEGTAYGVLLKPIIDNKQVIHHWLLFQDDIPGIPGGAVPTIGAHPAGQLLHGWAPGGDPLDLMKSGVSVGLEMPSSTTYTIEYHYNSKDPNAMDASGVEICVAKRKPDNIAAISWLGLDQLLIPSTKWVGTCVPISQEPIHIIAVVPHMHLKGTHMKSTINRKDGSKEILHDEPFDFEYQRLYDKDVKIMPGDTITTECTFSQPMTFGESTNAEMCYLFTLAYPKGALTGLDLWGRFAHGGSSCLGM